jgi:YHS domain-containing protein
MHPDIVKDVLGTCDICEMPLVTTESLGYVKVNAPNEAPVVIPALAPLITGTRAVVYVKVTQTEKPTYEGREVVLGPRAGDYYIVNSGLSEGEIVVSKGSFKIDSAMQIQAKPSMMSPRARKSSVLTGQTICPIMGGPINKDVFAEYKGKKVYFCCAGCEQEFNADPEKYVAKLPQFKD